MEVSEKADWDCRTRDKFCLEIEVKLEKINKIIFYEILSNRIDQYYFPNRVHHRDTSVNFIDKSSLVFVFTI